MIPLVKKLDIDEINTSLIAIRKLLNNAGITETNITNIVGKDYDIIIQEIQNQLNALTTYSTTEHWTGKYWIDGKKIYSKCYHFNGDNTSRWTLIDSTFTYEKYKIVSAYGCIDRVGEGSIAIPYNDGSRNFSIACWAYNDPYPNLRYLFLNGTSCVVDLIVEYTKTTDN